MARVGTDAARAAKDLRKCFLYLAETNDRLAELIEQMQNSKGECIKLFLLKQQERNWRDFKNDLASRI